MTNGNPRNDPCKCGHDRSQHAPFGGACLRCECVRYTWTAPKKGK